MPQQLPAIGDEVTPFGARAELPPIGGEVGQARVPDFTTTNEPPSASLKAAAYGKDALQLALDALPGAGAVVGGALATPETLGAGTLAGAALGAGAGRGLRDLLAAGLGLQKPSTALQEGGAIAMDVAETYVAGKVIPALWEAIKAPGATVADVYDGMRRLYAATPKAFKHFLPDFEALAKLPKGVGKAPAAILERPAWQTWQEHLPEAQPSPQVARTTGTSMIPASVPAAPTTAQPPMRTPAPAPRTAAPPIATPAPSPMTVAPSAELDEEARLFRELRETIARRQASAPSAAMAETSPFAKPVPNALPDQKALNEAALAARRAAYQASQSPTAETVVQASGKLHFTAPEWAAFRELRARGVSLEDAAAGAKAAGQLARQFGLSQPTAAQTRFPKGRGR